MCCVVLDVLCMLSVTDALRLTQVVVSLEGALCLVTGVPGRSLEELAILVSLAGTLLAFSLEEITDLGRSAPRVERGLGTFALTDIDSFTDCGLGLPRDKAVSGAGCLGLGGSNVTLVRSENAMAMDPLPVLMRLTGDVGNQSVVVAISTTQKDKKKQARQRSNT